MSSISKVGNAVQINMKKDNGIFHGHEKTANAIGQAKQCGTEKGKPEANKKKEDDDDEGYIEENEDDDNDDEDTFAEKDETDDFKPVVRGQAQLASSAKEDSYRNPQDVVKQLNVPGPLQQLAMPLPLVAAGHSLLPDMQFGWKPQADKEVPPIPFCFGLVHYNLEQFNYPKALYVGPRFTNSYKMHEQYANKLMKLPIQREDGENMSVYAYPFTFPKFYDSNTFTYEEAFNSFVESLEFDSSIHDQNLNFWTPPTNTNGKRDPKALLTSLSCKDEREEFLFDSNFESGNLDFVGKVSDNEYDLLMRLDSNSRSHQQWYYFSIDCKDIKKRATKGETIKLNIMNFTKPNSLYNQGMRPVAWSKQRCMNEGVGWHRVGTNIHYKLSKLCRNFQNNGGYNRIWYQMTFDYTFEYDQDKIWFAYAIPYSFTMLTNFIKAIEEIQSKPENMKNNQIFKKEVLGKSLSGVDIPILTITDFSETNKRKKTIIMVGRLHPGETHSSWLIHGFVRYLLSESPKARELRKKVVFKIVPMLNPDGVIVGNYRCTLAGCDMNRNFGGDSAIAQRLNPETVFFKKMAKAQQRVAFFFDVHSHSSKKSIFIYGPYFPLHSEHYLKIRVMPRLLSEKTQMFRYYSCRFRNEAHKMHCSRLTIFRECNLPHCYTIETSIMGFLSKDRQNVSFGIPSLQYFGEKLGETLLDWFQILEAHQREKIKKAIIMSMQRKTRKRTIIDIIGEEDYIEFRDVIDTQLVLQQQEELMGIAAGGDSSIGKKGKSKKSQSQGKRKFPKNQSRRKTLLGSSGFFGASDSVPSGGVQLDISRLKTQQSQLQPGQLQSDFISPKKGLENIQVGLDAYKHSQTSHKKGAKDHSSDDQDEEEEEDEDFDQNAVHNGGLSMKPMLPQNLKKKVTEPLLEDEVNRGFYVPKLAGFEYLEGPELLQQAAKQLKIQERSRAAMMSQTNSVKQANGDLADLDRFNVQDDDERFIYEDQQSSQDGDHPLRRLEDIVGEIRKDLIKANTAGNTGVQPTINVANGDLNENQQFYDEKDLDSQRSGNEQNDKKDEIDADYDVQMIKMQECLFSYFENVEDLQNKPMSKLARPAPQAVTVKKQPITVVIKELKPKPQQPPPEPTPLVAFPPSKSVSPVKIQRPMVIATQPKSESLMSQKKEIVFSIKKPTITKFPPDKPYTSHIGIRPNQYPPPITQQTFMHYKGSQGTGSSPHGGQQLDPKDLSFTLMHKTNQEFFDLLQKYVHTKAPHGNNQNQQRASSAFMTNKYPIQTIHNSAFMNNQQKQLNSSQQNQSLLYHMQQQQLLMLQQQHDNSQTDNNYRQQTVGNSSRNPSGLNSSKVIANSVKCVIQPVPISPDIGSSNNDTITVTRNRDATATTKLGGPFTNANISLVGLHPDSRQFLSKSGLKERQGIIITSQQQQQQIMKSGKLLNNQPSSLNITESPPQKQRRLVDSKGQIGSKSGSTGKKLKSYQTERQKNFLLMIDGRGVNTNFPGSAEKVGSIKIKGFQIDPTLSAAQIYDNQGTQRPQYKLKSSSTHGSKSFVYSDKKRETAFRSTSLNQKGVGSNKSNIVHHRVQSNNSQEDMNIGEADQSPKRIFTHSRHSSQSQQQDLTINQNSSPNNQIRQPMNQYSPVQITSDFFSNQIDDSPLKKGKNAVQERQLSAFAVGITTKRRTVEKKNINFYNSQQEEGNETDSARFYQAHLNNYFDESSSTGLQIPPSNLYVEQDTPQNIMKQQNNQHQRHAIAQYTSTNQYLNLSRADDSLIAINNQGNNYGNLSNVEQRNSSLEHQRRSTVSMASRQQYHQSNLKNDSEESSIRIKNGAEQVYSQIVVEGGGSHKKQMRGHNSGESASPMKNQLLIDMFRQTNSYSQQGKRSSMNLQPAMIAAAIAQNQGEKLKQQSSRLSGRLVVNISEIKPTIQGTNSGLKYQSSIVLRPGTSISPDKYTNNRQQKQFNSANKGMIVQHNATS